MKNSMMVLKPNLEKILTARNSLVDKDGVRVFHKVNLVPHLEEGTSGKLTERENPR